MNPTIDDLLRQIGELAVENRMLRLQLVKYEKSPQEKKEPKLKAVKRNDGDI